MAKTRSGPTHSGDGVPYDNPTAAVRGYDGKVVTDWTTLDGLSYSSYSSGRPDKRASSVYWGRGGPTERIPSLAEETARAGAFFGSAAWVKETLAAMKKKEPG